MSEKIDLAKRFDDTLSFTEMSTQIVDEPYQSNYQNVYYKGALINMCLDIIIREQSGGDRGLLDIMQALAKKYGVDKPFTDKSLFDEIVAMTYPAVGEFFDTHVQGETPIDYNAFLLKAGLALMEKDIALPSIVLIDNNRPFISAQPNQDGIPELVVAGTNNRLDDLGFREGDVLRIFNDTTLPELNKENAGMINELFGTSFDWTSETEVSFEVDRKGERIKLSGLAGEALVPAKGIQAIAAPTEIQKSIRKAWLYE
jgi:hypothetical protein